MAKKKRKQVSLNTLHVLTEKAGAWENITKDDTRYSITLAAAMLGVSMPYLRNLLWQVRFVRYEKFSDCGRFVPRLDAFFEQGLVAGRSNHWWFTNKGMAYLKEVYGKTTVPSL